MRLGAVSATSDGRDAVGGQVGQHVTKGCLAIIAAMVVRHGDNLIPRRVEPVERL